MVMCWEWTIKDYHKVGNIMDMYWERTLKDYGRQHCSGDCAGKEEEGDPKQPSTEYSNLVEEW